MSSNYHIIWTFVFCLVNDNYIWLPLCMTDKMLTVFEAVNIKYDSNMCQHLSASIQPKVGDCSMYCSIYGNHAILIVYSHMILAVSMIKATHVHGVWQGALLPPRIQVTISISFNRLNTHDFNVNALKLNEIFY